MSIRWAVILKVVTAVICSFILMVIALIPSMLVVTFATYSPSVTTKKISIEAWRNLLLMSVFIGVPLGGIGYFISYQLLKSKLAGWIVFGLIVFFAGMFFAILENPI